MKPVVLDADVVSFLFKGDTRANCTFLAFKDTAG